MTYSSLRLDLASPEFPVAEKEANKIMQISLPIGGGNMLIGNDVPEFMGKVSENENRSKIHVNLDSKEEAESSSKEVYYRFIACRFCGIFDTKCS